MVWFCVCVFVFFLPGAHLSAFLMNQRSFARQVVSVPSEEKLQVDGNKVGREVSDSQYHVEF